MSFVTELPQYDLDSNFTNIRNTCFFAELYKQHQQEKKNNYNKIARGELNVSDVISEATIKDYVPKKEPKQKQSVSLFRKI